MSTMKTSISILLAALWVAAATAGCWSQSGSGHGEPSDTGSDAYDPGHLLWAVRAGGKALLDDGRDVAVLEDGSVLVCGAFVETAEFGPGEPGEMTMTSDGYSDIFVAKLNADGELQWARRAGGEGSDVANAIAAFPDGSFVVTGYFQETATFGPGESGEATLDCAGTSDIFVAFYASDGSLLWTRRAGSVSVSNPLYQFLEVSDMGRDVAIWPAGEIVVTGTFAEIGVFGEGQSGETELESAGGTDLFVARYDEDGQLLRARRAGGDGDDVANGIAGFTDGSVAVTGSFVQSATFGPEEENETTLHAEIDEPCYLKGSGEYWEYRDIFVARFDSTGDLEWATSEGGFCDDEGKAVVASADDSLFVTGYFRKNGVFGQGQSGQVELTGSSCQSSWSTSNYTYYYDDYIDTAFAARYDAGGQVKWAAQGAGNSEPPLDMCTDKTTGASVGRAISVTPDGRAIVAGTFLGITTFGEGEVNETVFQDIDDDGWEDTFVATFQPDGSLDWAIRAGGGHWGYGLGMVLGPDDAFVLTGFFSGDATFGVDEANQITLHSAGGWDAFAAKYALGSE